MDHAHRDYFVQANRSDDKSTHNSSEAFDEMSELVVQWTKQPRREKKNAVPQARDGIF